ncbi:MAG: glycosyltransferase family 4 protein [Pyrinomonadaceae bacterium]
MVKEAGHVAHEGRDEKRASGGDPWLIVAGGFHSRGGMDKANAALATYLLERGHTVHLVAHEIDSTLSGHPLARAHVVARPGNSVLLGEQRLSLAASRMMRALRAHNPRARVVANGGNFVSPDINWVHAVHGAWPPSDTGAPLWFRVKNRLGHALVCRRERGAIRRARLVVANSERTRRDLVELVGVAPERVRTVYLGGGDALASPRERAEARRWLGVEEARPVVLFAGALGHDHNKGFDTLWRAWRELSSSREWGALLIVAGGGRGLGLWRGRVAGAGLQDGVRFLDFSERLPEVLAASDLLVSPVRYEAYGLNVHEAVCRGVPALVSRCAGVAERYPEALSEMLLPDPEDAADLAARLLRWRRSMHVWKEEFQAFAAHLGRRSWSDVAADIVALAEGERAQSISKQPASEGEGVRLSSVDERTRYVSVEQTASSVVAAEVRLVSHEQN